VLVGVFVGVSVLVGVIVGVRVLVGVIVGVRVLVGVIVGVRVLVGVVVIVGVGVLVGVVVIVGVRVLVGVGEWVILSVGVCKGGVCEGLGTLFFCSLTCNLYPVKLLTVKIPCPGTFNLLPANKLLDFFLKFLPIIININGHQITIRISHILHDQH
jgi:hypothetical protein